MWSSPIHVTLVGVKGSMVDPSGTNLKLSLTGTEHEYVRDWLGRDR